MLHVVVLPESRTTDEEEDIGVSTFRFGCDVLSGMSRDGGDYETEVHVARGMVREGVLLFYLRRELFYHDKQSNYE